MKGEQIEVFIRLFLVVIPCLLWLAGCDKGSAPPGGAGGSFTLVSSDFQEGKPIPKKHAYSGEGRNTSPQLEWGNAPAGTAELALIMDDPDAPTPQPWAHWVLYRIPSDTTSLQSSRGGQKITSFGPLQGRNSWGKAGYGGPLPPPGKPHRYIFTLYALDKKLGLKADLSREQLLAAMEGHVLGQARLTGTYQR